MKKTSMMYLVLAAILTVVLLVSGTVCSSPTATPVPTKAPATTGPTPTPVVVVATPTSGGPTPTQGAPEILKIGNYGMIAGAGAAYGRAFTHSVELAVEDLNLSGGLVLGGKRYMFQVVTLDSGYAVDTGRATGERLVNTEKVKYVFGVGTANSLGVQEVTEKNKVLLLTETWSNPVIAKDKVYTFRNMMGGDGQEASIYSVMKALYPDKKKVYYQSTDTITWRQGYEVSIPANEKNGYQTVGIDYADPAITDWYPVVTKIKAAKPDFVDLFMSAVYAGPFFKAAHELGLHPGTQLIWPVGDGVQAALSVAGKEAAEGIFFTQEWDWYGKFMSDTGKAYAKRYKDRFGEEVTIHGFLAYDMVFGLVEAMKKTNSLDPTVLKDAIPDLKWASPSMGKDSVLEFVDVGGRKAGMVYNQVLGQYKDGKVVNVALMHPTKPPVFN